MATSPNDSPWTNHFQTCQAGPVVELFCKPSVRISRGFTLIELLVVIAVVGILASLLLPALSKSRDTAVGTRCQNQVRQLALASLSYAEDSEGHFPTRSKKSNWPILLKKEFVALDLLFCPGEKTAAITNLALQTSAVTYSMNGFNDYFFPMGSVAGSEEKRPTIPDMVLSGVLHPSQTIMFGEKRKESSQIYVDLIFEPETYFLELNEERHGKTQQKRGMANYGFIDGSVRPMGYGRATCPINFWAVTDAARNHATLCRPR